jgi:transposase
MKNISSQSNKSLRRNTQEELIAMKKQILDQYIEKQIKCKDGAKLLQMHEKAFLRLKARYRTYGEQALIPKRPGPKKGSTAHNRTPEWIEAMVVEVSREYRFLGPIPLADKLNELYGIVLNPTTLWRILKRNGVRYFRDYLPIEKQKPKLYCLDTPGEEVQIDGCYPFGRLRKLVAFSAIDDCSRHVYSNCYTRETAENAMLFVKELVKRVPYRIQRIRVDNRYGKQFKSYCEEVLGIEVIENEPYNSNQNGKVERFNKTLKYDFFWTYCKYNEPMEDIQYKLTQWLGFYNYKRKHTGYKMSSLTPAQKIASTYLLSIAQDLVYYPQKVTLSMQQYVF